MLAVAVLAACSAGSDPPPPGDPGARGETDAQTASGVSEVCFPQVREGLGSGPGALAGGRLFVGENGCLRLKPDKGATQIPVWPASLRLETEAGRIRIRETAGADRGRGRKGGLLHGRGQIGLPKDVVRPRTARELRDRCPGDLGDCCIAVNPSLDPVTPVGSISPQG